VGENQRNQERCIRRKNVVHQTACGAASAWCGGVRDYRVEGSAWVPAFRWTNRGRGHGLRREAFRGDLQVNFLGAIVAAFWQTGYFGQQLHRQYVLKYVLAQPEQQLQLWGGKVQVPWTIQGRPSLQPLLKKQFQHSMYW
jgi:hypothetical protein